MHFVSMWTGKRVEQALFHWGKWRRSLVLQWLDVDIDWELLSQSQLRSKSTNELRALELLPCIQLQVYWICCIISDYSFDDSSPYREIRMPNWLWSRYRSVVKDYGIDLRHASNRVYPPEVWTEDDGITGVDVDKFDYSQVHLYHPQDIQYDTNIPAVLQNRDKPEAFHAWETYDTISLSSSHELYGILKGLKGRPQEHRKRRGRKAHYSDRLAVRCALLKDKKGMADYEIALKFNLPTKRYYSSNQSDTVRHLVEKGRRLLESVELSWPI